MIKYLTLNEVIVIHEYLIDEFGGSSGIREFYDKVVKIMFKWLNRRSQRRSYNWYIYRRMIRYHGILMPRISERYSKQKNYLANICDNA